MFVTNVPCGLALLMIFLSDVQCAYDSVLQFTRVSSDGYAKRNLLELPPALSEWKISHAAEYGMAYEQVVFSSML